MYNEFYVDKLRVIVTKTRAEMGAAAASDAAEYMHKLLSEKAELTAIFAAAPSQNEVLDFVSREDIAWNRVIAYHMDEYVGLASDAPQRFSRYLDSHKGQNPNNVPNISPYYMLALPMSITYSLGIKYYIFHNMVEHFF